MNTGLRRLGKYELHELIGTGGMAEVWKAFDLHLQRHVAIKLLRADLQNDPNFIKRFTREARLVASLHHPNIVQIHDFQVSHPPESVATVAYMVMDYVEGQTLADYIHSTSSKGNFPPAAAIVHLFTSISSAIDYAHQSGMIHRDIKPANILLDKRLTAQNAIGEPILTDFGIAKLTGITTAAMSGYWLGATHYISPEQLQGQPGNERSDIYALGVILYEICTGVLPFRGDDPTAIMMQHINAAPTPPEFINPNISPALSAAILHSLAKDPLVRFPSASSMTAALAQAFNMPLPENLGQVTQSMAPEKGSISLSPAPEVSLKTFLSLSSVSTFIPSPANSPVLPPPTPGQPSSVTSRQRGKRRGVLLVLVALVILIVGGSSFGIFYLLSHSAATSTATLVVGHASFFSSGLLSQENSQGIEDEFQIDLHNISGPAAGKRYYGWLLGDRLKNTSENHCQVQQELISLGPLAVNHNTIHSLYLGDAQHTNLLGCTSRFLITEESTSSMPVHPSSDKLTWRYYAELPQSPNPAEPIHPLSALDYFRHLLFEGLNLQSIGIHGGLDIQFLRNIEKVWEWASSARDVRIWGSSYDSNFIHRQVVRILDYIDGMNVQIELPGQPLLVDANLAQVPLLGLPNKVAGYVSRISHQLNSIIASPGITSEMRMLAMQLGNALTNVKTWLEQVHQDAKQLVMLTDTQLLQPAVLLTLDDIQTEANNAFVGRTDPSTNKVEFGMKQINNTIQELANFDVMAYQ